MIPIFGKSRSRVRCHPHIVTAGLPHRSEVVLKREERLYGAMVDRLMGIGRREERGFEEAAPSLTMKMLEDAFAKREATVMPAAAFLAGRCQPEAPELQGKLTALLDKFLKSLPVDNLDIMAASYIEAAMSLALRGEPDEARIALIPLITNYASSTTRSYLAAFYLAQLGDPSGYAVMLEALRDPNEHTRLMAVRHLIGFKPYDGRTVQGKVVDIRVELVQSLKDQLSYVRVEVPNLLAEAGVDGLEEILLPVANNDTDPDVRQASRDIIEALP